MAAQLVRAVGLLDTLMAWRDDYGLGQVLPTYYITLQNMYEEQRALKSKLNNIEETTERIVQGKQYVTRRKELSLD